MGCYSHSSVTTPPHQDERVSLLDRPRPVRRATHLLRPVRHPPVCTTTTRTQFCDTQCSLGDRSLFIFLVIPDRPVRSALLPIPMHAVVPTQLAHLRLEALRKDRKPRRPTEGIVGLLYALQTIDVGLERLERHTDLLAQSVEGVRSYSHHQEEGKKTHFSIEDSTSSRPRRTDDREPESVFAFDACSNRSSWCAVT